MKSHVLLSAALLAALGVAGSARAQFPVFGPVQRVNAGPSTLPPTYAPPTTATQQSVPTSGGCASGNCGSSGHFSFLHGHSGCNTCSTGIVHKVCGWWKSPSPNNAPTIHQPQPPLGFPSHPYIRSPRDYFMQED